MRAGRETRRLPQSSSSVVTCWHNAHSDRPSKSCSKRSAASPATFSSPTGKAKRSIWRRPRTRCSGTRLRTISSCMRTTSYRHRPVWRSATSAFSTSADSLYRDSRVRRYLLRDRGRVTLSTIQAAFQDRFGAPRARLPRHHSRQIILDSGDDHHGHDLTDHVGCTASLRPAQVHRVSASVGTRRPVRCGKRRLSRENVTLRRTITLAATEPFPRAPQLAEPITADVCVSRRWLCRALSGFAPRTPGRFGCATRGIPHR